MRRTAALMLAACILALLLVIFLVLLTGGGVFDLWGTRILARTIDKPLAIVAGLVLIRDGVRAWSRCLGAIGRLHGLPGGEARTTCCIPDRSHSTPDHFEQSKSCPLARSCALG